MIKDTIYTLKVRASKDADIIKGVDETLERARKNNEDLDRSTLLRKALRYYLSKCE